MFVIRLIKQRAIEGVRPVKDVMYVDVVLVVSGVTQRHIDIQCHKIFLGFYLNFLDIESFIQIETD